MQSKNDYNGQWIIQRLGYQMPAPTQKYLQAVTIGGMIMSDSVSENSSAARNRAFRLTATVLVIDCTAKERRLKGEVMCEC